MMAERVRHLEAVQHLRLGLLERDALERVGGDALPGATDHRQGTDGLEGEIRRL